MTDPTAQEKARDALFDGIAEKLQTVGTLEAVVQLSDAFSKVAYGPQGGVSVDSMHYVYDADYHDTKHEGEKRERPSGFAPPHA